MPSASRKHIDRFCERPDAGVFIRRAAVGSCLMLALGWLVMGYAVLLLSGVARYNDGHQEAFNAAPRGMAARVSLAEVK